jgi:hypothetical protein
MFGAQDIRNDSGRHECERCAQTVNVAGSSDRELPRR